MGLVNYNTLSSITGFTGKSALVAVGGFSAAAISCFVLKALGFTKTFAAVVSVTFVGIAAIGVTGVAVGVVSGFVALCVMLAQGSR